MRKLFSILFLSLGLFGYAQQPNYFLQGVSDLKNNNPDAAMQNLDKALKEDKYSARSYLYRGIAYYQTQLFTLAASDLSQAWKNGNPEAALWLAKIKAQLGEADSCINYIQAYLKINPFASKSELLSISDFQPIQNSASWYAFVSSSQNSPLEEAIEEVRYYFKNNRPEDALSSANQAISLYGNDVILLDLRAQVYNSLQNFSLAAADYRTLLKTNPSSSRFLKSLAQCQLNQKEFTQASENLRSLIAEVPEDFELYLLHGTSELGNKQPEKALKSINTLLNYFPADSTALFLSAQAYFDLGQHQQALRSMNSLFEKYPPNARWFSHRGRCYFSTGAYNPAAYDFSMSLDLDPRNPQANLMLGNCYSKLGQPEKACYFWKRALNYGELQATEYLLDFCQ